MHVLADRLCVALDSSDRDHILQLAGRLGGEVGWLKIGLEAFVAHGPALVHELVACAAKVFLDLKLHDIPATVQRASANAARSGARLVTVHAAGGRRMIEAARSGVHEGSGGRRTSVLAVTVLTSLDASDLAELGFADPSELVSRWARLAIDAGADGVVASAHEAAALRSALGPEALVVTPGIRMPGGEEDDQRRVSHPAAALAAGADLLVVGRPITGAADPIAAARAMLTAMGGAS